MRLGIYSESGRHICAKIYVYTSVDRTDAVNLLKLAREHVQYVEISL
jgi:hypothetical protein